MAEPTSPPIRACEDDEGSPKYQVIRFQVMAPEQAGHHDHQPVRAGRRVITSLTVCATFWPRNAPTKFMTAARASATRGVSARVDTEVAIALAASWNPLV